MKKVLAVLLSVILLAAFAGCGTGTGKSSEEETQPALTAAEPLNLTGLWVQEDKNEEMYMTASIREDGKIGVFFLMKGDETPWVYWVGSYKAPDSAKDEYKWTSENQYAGIGLLASDAETKDFSYKGGKLSYAVTIQGQTKKMILVRGDWDASKVPEEVYTEEPAGAVEPDFKEIEIKDSGWIVKDSGYLYCYVVLHNPNEETAVEFPSFRVTARDAQGGLMGTEDQTLSMLYPGQDFVYGGMAFSVDGMPAAVDFEVLETKDYNRKNVSTMDPYIPLEVVSANYKDDDILGEIRNPNDYKINTAIVVAICRDGNGEIIGIENGFADDIAAGTITPFSFFAYVKGDVKSVECFANYWM